MSEIVLKATARHIVGKQVRALRREGKLPAVIYGHNITPVAISLDFREASYILPGVSSSQIVTVEVDGAPHQTLVRERQRHPVTSDFVHIDFQEISMTEKLRVTVALQLQGDAPAVKEFNGVIVTGQEELEVECLPTDMPSHIEIDLGVLKEIGDAIYVRDITLPANVEMLTDADEMVVLVTAPAAEAVEEGEELFEEESSEPEVIERGKKEEEEDY